MAVAFLLFSQVTLGFLRRFSQSPCSHLSVEWYLAPLKINALEWSSWGTSEGVPPPGKVDKFLRSIMGIPRWSNLPVLIMTA